MRIGELAEATAVSPRSLRYYEERGLLRSERTPGGQRVYPGSAVDRVIRIQQLFAAGLSSRKIGDILPCLDAPPTERTGMLLDELLGQRRSIDECIKDLHRARATLDEVIDGLG